MKLTPVNLLIDRISSPIGQLLLVTDGENVRALDFADYEDRMDRLLRLHYGAVVCKPESVRPVFRSLIEAYFDGDLEAITKIPVETNGTAFQRQVWKALRDIPTGKTESYGALAARIGNPGASRAVGLANGSNPVAIIVPCHRVIGSSGILTGYGGGLDRKRWLLNHELNIRAKFVPDIRAHP